MQRKTKQTSKKEGKSIMFNWNKYKCKDCIFRILGDQLYNDDGCYVYNDRNNPILTNYGICERRVLPFKGDAI
jgi:hypothetical protein